MENENMVNEVEVMDQMELQEVEPESEFTDLSEYEGSSDRFVEGAAIGAAITGGVVAVALLVKKVIAPAIAAGAKATKQYWNEHRPVNEKKKWFRKHPEEAVEKSDEEILKEAEIIEETKAPARKGRKAS